MKNGDQDAIMKVTKIPTTNCFAFNNFYEAEITQKLSCHKGFPQLFDCGMIEDYSY